MWCEKSFNTIELLPDFFKNIYEYQILCKIYDNELDLFQKELIQTMNNFFIETANSTVIDKYCMLFDIDLNQDKFENLKKKLSEIPPYNINSLETTVNRITGGTCKVSIISNYHIKIEYSSLYINVDKTLIMTQIYNILPANIYVNLIYDFCTYGYIKSYNYQNISNISWLELMYRKFR